MRKLFLSTISLLLLLLISCGKEKTSNEAADKAETKTEQPAETSDPMKDKGIGPVTSITLPDEIDQAMVTKGSEIFAQKCSACHKPDKRFVGPAPKGILERRTPEWIMNMILNPEEMVQKNEAAKALLAEYLSPMANQNLTEEEARAVLEYFRTLN